MKVALYRLGNKQGEYFFVQSFSSVAEVGLNDVSTGFVAESERITNWPNYLWHENLSERLLGATIRFLENGCFVK